MQSSGIHTISIQGQVFHLHPFRAAYWAEASTLLLADLHLGKAAHFRRSGIPVPQGVGDANWDRLVTLLLDFSPEQVLFLGDLFHSDYNAEWAVVERLTAQFAHISFGLVPGNHDRLDHRHYRDARLAIYEEPLSAGPFLLTHHPMEEIPAGRYNLAGHIHPCVQLRGRGRQSLRLPCFYFGEKQGILPAFGAFTGMGNLEIRQGDRIFVIADDRVMDVKSP